jgi:hypothetical protein
MYSSLLVITVSRLLVLKKGVRFPILSDIFSSSERPDTLWGPKVLPFNEYRNIFSGVKAAVTHLHPVSKLRIHGPITPLPYTSSR